jgi:hypothetical protein
MVGWSQKTVFRNIPGVQYYILFPSCKQNTNRPVCVISGITSCYAAIETPPPLQLATAAQLPFVITQKHHWFPSPPPESSIFLLSRRNILTIITHAWTTCLVSSFPVVPCHTSGADALWGESILLRWPDSIWPYDQPENNYLWGFQGKSCGLLGQSKRNMA